MVIRKTETLYRKSGRRYTPVAEYDLDRGRVLANGAWLVRVGGGCTSYSRFDDFDADVEVGALVARFTRLELADVVASAIHKAIEDSRDAEGVCRLSIADEAAAVADALMEADVRLLARV